MIDPSLFESIVEIRRDIHRHPEIEFDVERTAGIAAKEMKKHGIKVRTGVGESGVVGDLEVPEATGRIAFRADMDALPMQEEGSPPYKSTVDGKAHMCGHDSHTAMLIGAAHLLSKKKDQLKKHIRFIFQPCEEKSPGGAPGMIADGCLEGVDSIYGLHVWPWLESGTIGICPGPVMAQADLFDIKIEGKGGHAAAPHNNVDPIIVGSHLVTALQTLVSRITDPLHPAVLSVTKFDSGSAYNVTPSTATLSGTVRTYDTRVLSKLKAAFSEMVQQCARSFGAKATLHYQEGYPPVINPEEGCAAVQEAAQKFADHDHIVFPAEKAMFGEDFAYYLQKVPGCFIQLGCRNESKNCIYPLHHPCFDIDEECMKTGIRLFEELTCSR